MALPLYLSREDQLRRTTAEQLPAYADAVLSQFKEVAASINTFGQRDHAFDGAHAAVEFRPQPTPFPRPGSLVVWWDGINLHYIKPDGTTGTIL